MEGRSLSWVMPVCFGGSSAAAAARAGWWPCGAWSCEHQGPSSAVENSELSGVTPRVKGVERSDPTRQEDGIGPCASVSESERLLHGDMLKICTIVNMLHYTIFILPTPNWLLASHGVHVHTQSRANTSRPCDVRNWQSGVAERLHGSPDRSPSYHLLVCATVPSVIS
jgi:hypothetical protein